MTSPADTIPYRPARIDAAEMLTRLRADRAVADARRSVRMFDSAPVPREAIEEAIRIAGTAPSGANRQPWYFVAISDADMKQQIRDAAEKEERAFYDGRASDAWLDAISHLGTDFVKAHLTEAPWVVVLFRRDAEPLEDGGTSKNYYANESVGIALGFFIQALHRAGLAVLTHTPAPMTFLRELCGRPKNEKPFVLLPVGYPAADCEVPDIHRKPLGEIAEFR